ncbi:MAG TPA: lysophospholipid acyltransferase family protein [Nocardioides sp.]|nr:lysophospholipid acyltransferase family protein [Nocardioides sp.]
MWFFLLKWVVLGPVVRWYSRPQVIGMDRMPRKGPVIIAPNHTSEIESFVLCLVLRRQPRFIAKAEYFSGKGLRGMADRIIVKATGQIPVDRAAGGDKSAALEAAADVLRQGDVWAVYPEGTRSPDGRLYRGHTGALRVALEVPGVTVLPVAISGAREVDNPGRRGWKRGRVRIEFGEPLPLSSYDASSPEDWRAATDELMRRIRTMSGQEYVDSYPPRRSRG